MYRYTYPRSYTVGFGRSIGYSIGHVIAHTLVKEGQKQMVKMIENRHRIIDADFVDIPSASQRWDRKRAHSGMQNDFSTSWNKPKPQPTYVYPRAHKTPVYKILFWMAVGALGFFYFGTDYFNRLPNNVESYYYMPDGRKMCLYKTFPGQPKSEWDLFPRMCQ
jgi:hypothetical protein